MTTLPVFLFYVVISIGFSSAIISPPNAVIEKVVEAFNEWRDVRKEFMDSMKHPMGLPHFNCPTVTDAPVSVHRLHPSHIDVVAALGDSVSVAQAAEASTVLELLKEFPGVSFVTGEDVSMSEQATLFNMFRQFSPRVKGGSSDQIRRFYDFNFAVPGAFSYELPEQANHLAQTLKRRLSDYSNTWKFVNLFIGHNDLCQYCNNKTLYGPETFGKSIQTALSIIRSKVPKVFVNIMPPINVQIHSEAHNVSEFCEIAHQQTCPCIFKMSKEEYLDLKNKFDDELKKVVDDFNSEGSSDSTAVIAPAMNLKSIPLLNEEPNVGLLALDCFHLSPIAHDIAAKQIWKGLFERVNAKSVTSQLSRGFDRFVCPPIECPYLRTSENSKECTPPKELKMLQIPLAPLVTEANQSQVQSVMFFGFFLAGSALILMFVRSTFRSPSLSDERRHLLLPQRADLNDNIF